MRETRSLRRRLVAERRCSNNGTRQIREKTSIDTKGCGVGRHLGVKVMIVVEESLSTRCFSDARRTSAHEVAAFAFLGHREAFATAPSTYAIVTAFRGASGRRKRADVPYNP
jgi:hypothetical protein